MMRNSTISPSEGSNNEGLSVPPAQAIKRDGIPAIDKPSSIFNVAREQDERQGEGPCKENAARIMKLSV